MTTIALLGTMLAGYAHAETTPAQDYLDRMLEANAAAVQDLDHYCRVADAAAQLLVRDPDGPGPALWLAGDRGFVLEGFNRAGGLMIAKRLGEVDEVAPGDVVLVGSLYGDDEGTTALLEGIADRGALAVLFAPRPAATSADHLFIDTHSEAPDESDLPTASPANAQSLWTFTAELVTAMMARSGRVPPVFRSVLVPDGREYNAALKGRRWEGAAESVYPPGLVGRRYLARVANMMRTLRATQADEFAEAGRRSREVLARGGTVWLGMLGHLPPSQPEQVPADEMPFTVLSDRDPDRFPELVKPGDLVLYVGYYEPIGPWVQAAHDAGAQIVTVVSGTPERPASAMGADINICGCWPYGDVTVRRSPSADGPNMLPPSGVIQSAAVWMLLAENRRTGR